MATYLLVPGAGGAAWYWHRVVPLLRACGHEAVAVDLPGDDPAAGLEAYTAAVVRAAERRAGPLVVVAQSLGAFTAPLACARLPAALLVLLNPMTPLPGETAGEWWEATGQPAAHAAAARAAGRAGGGIDVAVDLLHDVPPEVVTAGEAHRRDEAERVFGDPWPLPAWPDVPTRVLCGLDDRLFPIGFQRRVVRERLGLVPDEVPGGHLVALSRPDEVVRRLEAYRAAVVP